MSAGLLMYKGTFPNLEVFLVHPGGPFYKNKDEGAWSIPKGELEHGGEDPLDAALREFEEETGIKPAPDNLIALNSVKQKGGKTVYAWAFAGDFSGPIRSNMFEMEWPPRSGQMQKFPEVDEGKFFDATTAKKKINEAQAAFIERLMAALG